MNAFATDYASQMEPIKATKPRKAESNPFDGNDHKARQARVHLPKVSPQSRADVIRRSNSKV